MLQLLWLHICHSSCICFGNHVFCINVALESLTLTYYLGISQSLSFFFFFFGSKELLMELGDGGKNEHTRIEPLT